MPETDELIPGFISRLIQGMRAWEWMRKHPQYPLHPHGGERPPMILILLIPLVTVIQKNPFV